MDTSGPEHYMLATTLGGFGHTSRIHDLIPRLKLKQPWPISQKVRGKTLLAVIWTDLANRLELASHQGFFEPHQPSYGM